MKAKKIITFLISIIMVLFLFPNSVSAAGASMSGPSTVNAGDTISVQMSVNGSNFGGFEGSISWDAGKLQLSGASKGASDPWVISLNQSASSIYFTGYASDGSTSSNITVVYMTFNVIASGGSSISVNASGVNLTIDGSDVPAGSASYSTTITAPSTPTTPSTPSNPGTPYVPSNPSGSSDNKLSSLSVAEGSLSPAFNADTTEYTLAVPFAVAALNISATPNDSKATVIVNNNTLLAGKTTTVSIDVRAENGALKTYVINTAREQDPNYVPSANNYLASLVPSYGALSPTFNKDVLYYAINVPYECDKMLFTAAVEDTNTTSIVLGDPSLLPGIDSLFHVVCTAENKSVRIYNIVVRRASIYNTFISDEYTNSIITRINGQNEPIVLEMSKSPVQIISSKILSALKAKSTRILIINTPNGKITLQGSDLSGNITEGFYDFTINNSSQYKEELFSKAANGVNAVFSTHFSGELPGYAEFAVYTNIPSGSNVNIYQYDKANDKYIAIAKNVRVDGGTVTFRNNTGGDFLITTSTILGASNSNAVTMQNKTNQMTYPIIIGTAFLFGLLGFGAASLWNKYKKKADTNLIPKNKVGTDNTKKQKLFGKKAKDTNKIIDINEDVFFTKDKPSEGIEAIIDNIAKKTDNDKPE